MKLINADALIYEIPTLGKTTFSQEEVIALLAHAPAEPITDNFSKGYAQGYEDGKNEKAVNGHWKADTNKTYTECEDVWECSICGEPYYLETGTPEDNQYNYCPNCGARLIHDKTV